MIKVKKSATAKLPTDLGEFSIIIYEGGDGKEHAVLQAGGSLKEDVLVRIHSQCLTGDVFHSVKCDCRGQLEMAMKAIAKEGGLLIYLQQEGRGIGLANKIKAYALQDQGMDTVEANKKLGFAPDQRNYEVAASILKDIGVSSIRLLTNNPEKIQGLEEHGINITQRVPLRSREHPQARNYLRTKKEKMGHLLD